MNKILTLFFALILLGGCAQRAKHFPCNCETYVEANLPVEVISDWSALRSGLHSSIGSIDVRYVRHEIPYATRQTQWSGTAWRGERVSAQMVVWSSDSVAQIHGRFSDFRSQNGNVIPADAANIHFVRYVITDEFAQGCGHRRPEDFASSLSPDVLDNLPCFNLSPNSTRPIWITMDVPRDAQPGIYTATLQLFADGRRHERFTFQLEVLPQTLPPPSEWAFHLDLWQNPFAVARVAGVEVWSPEHWEALRKPMTMLANAGQKVITATLNNRPWDGQTQDPFESMIKWTKRADGTWEFDYTVFDNWVKFMMDLGIDAQINAYSMVPWGNFMFYYDEAKGEEVRVRVLPGTQEYADLWRPFLIDFVRHLDERGWREITLIAMDERRPEDMKAMLDLLESAAPGMRVAMADNQQSHRLFVEQLADISVEHSNLGDVDSEDIIARRARGQITTWYVCCADIFPNVFTFSDPAEGAFIGWFTMAADFDGFLRWAYNSWVAEPLIDSRFRTWPAGDTSIIYPDARSSIRFERLIEGIQDAEKIRILREQFHDNPEKLNRLNSVLEKFNILKRPDNLEELMAEGKRVLEELSRQ
jgi:hypothetical protein